MESIGLMPSSTHAPDGKRIGQNMGHYIIDGGAFDVVANELLSSGFKIDWSSFLVKKESSKKKNKIKYTCPECNQNAWAKPCAKLACGVCELALEAE